MRTGLTKQEKTTDIWFDEKDPLIHIRTHNTALKNRLTAYAAAYPGECSQTDADPDTGCMEFEIRKGRFSFRLTAPYSEEWRNAASKAAKKHSGNLTHPIQKDVLTQTLTETQTDMPHAQISHTSDEKVSEQNLLAK